MQSSQVDATDESSSVRLPRIASCLGTLLVAILAFGISPALGQAIDTQSGLRVGGAFMTIGGDDAPSDLTRRSGWMLGGFATFDVAGPFALQPELNYIQKGAQDETASPTVTTKLNYIQLPILAKVQTPSPGLVSPNVFLGPSAALNIKAEEEAGSSTNDISDDIRSFDLGAVFGVGVDANVGTGTLLVDARYGLGLIDITDDDDVGTTDPSLRNQGFMLTVGYAF